MPGFSQISSACFASVIVLSTAGAARAHTVVTTYTPRVQHYNGHGHASDHGFWRNFFRALAGDESEPEGVVVAVSPDFGPLNDPRPLVMTGQSEAERYQLATGRALPAKHGLILVPPTTPRGDSTFIWPSGDSQ